MAKSYEEKIASTACLRMDREARELLRAMAGKKSMDAYVATLIHREAARLEERQRLRDMANRADSLDTVRRFLSTDAD